ncbi:hypothetical protein HY969_04100 [Candidatus Kaiserbacteria bacterium]|nr:hypothetical protein [Candidatus Kaiserbacteria bacterium]
MIDSMKGPAYAASGSDSSGGSGEDLADFKNSETFGTNRGPFSVELTDTADKTVASGSVSFNGNIAQIDDSGMLQNPARQTELPPGQKHPISSDNVKFQTYHGTFSWPKSHIKVIRGADGSPIWVNHEHYPKK